jgi:hypothetical protein
MPTDIQGLFAMLEAARTRYVLVGGLALVLHGIDRLTADVDLAVDLAPEEALRLVALLEQAGYRPVAPVDPKQLADPAIRAAWHRDRNMRVFSYWDSTGKRPTIDIFIASPIAFEELWQDAVRIDMGGDLTVSVASISHLEDRSNKEPVNRAADEPPAAWGTHEDAEALRRWAFLRRTPAERLAWLVEMLEIAYRTGALKPRGPDPSVSGRSQTP